MFFKITSDDFYQAAIACYMPFCCGSTNSQRFRGKLFIFGTNEDSVAKDGLRHWTNNVFVSANSLVLMNIRVRVLRFSACLNLIFENWFSQSIYRVDGTSMSYRCVKLGLNPVHIRRLYWVYRFTRVHYQKAFSTTSFDRRCCINGFRCWIQQ
jgi:hypothetical protein